MAVLRALAVLTLLLLASASAGAEPSTAEEVLACMRGNLPDASMEQTVEFTSRDRTGYERVSRAQIRSKRLDDGLRRVVARFTRPLDVRGSEFLIIETPDAQNEMWVYSPELRNTKRLSARATMGSLFGTDFTYEDFERFQGMNRPGEHQRLEDSAIAGRPVFVIETRPAASARSTYSRIVSHIDQETCVTMRSESFQGNSPEPRKRLECDPEQVRRSGDVWVAHDVVIRDLLDQTETRLLIEDLRVGIEIEDRCFMHSSLGRRGC